ncbi:TetR/AcrR family transcriptional regulator, partial [Candidatus Binatia bacterium]|nr:TetR/AcrR family transcriptional regulator [Candidatus Binatia bacterium]
SAARQRPRGRRSREEAARTRQRILDRAERLFAKKGYRAVSTRELARACGVHPYTIQHHFGSKPKLYEAVLCRWDEPIRAMTRRHTLAAESAGDASSTPVTGEMIDELLDFLLAKRDWITLNMRSRLGEGLPRGVASADPGWIRFLSDTRPSPARRAAADVENSLLLITIEGILHQHVTSQQRYRELLGRDLGDPELRKVVKQHLAAVIRAIVEGLRDDG